MSSRPFFALALILSLPVSGWSQSDIKPAPCFQNNMVLQRGGHTLIYGTGPAGKSIWLRFTSASGKLAGQTWKSPKTDSSGRWQLTLDLTRSQLESPCGLRLSVAGRSRGSLVLTNVALGDVWLMAGWKNQGLAASAGEIIDYFDRKQVRFWDLAGAGATLGSGIARPPVWTGWPEPPEFGRYSTLTIRLAHLLALGKFTGLAEPGYVGIVLTTPEDLNSGLEPQLSVPASQENYHQTDWQWVNARTREAEDVWMRRLIADKRQGIATNLPPVQRYDAPSVFPYAAFLPNSAPANRFTFKGAIWPRKPGAQAR
jgi:hypothetical protein